MSRNGPVFGGRKATPDRRNTSLDPVSTLRGARIEVDSRRATQVVVGVCLVATVVLAIVLFVVGVHKNTQISELRNHGVPVQVTVTKCLGLLGGSGTNAAGYACTGTFVVDRHRYSEIVPGTTLYPPGTRIKAITAPGDPGLFSTATEVASEHASFGVFIVPILLLGAFVGLIGVVVARRRSKGVVIARARVTRR